MSQVNIIIPKRGRDNYLDTCLYYLNLCCLDKQFKVNVYVIDDTTKLPFKKYDNFNLTSIYLPNSGLFNKSKLINRGLLEMEKNFDWFSIVDVDMVYSTNFLSQVHQKILSGVDYIVSHGYKMQPSLSAYVMATKPEILIIQESSRKEEFKVGPSQISMTKNTYELFLNLFGSPMYDEYYEGWGTEDTDISFKSAKLQRMNKMRKDTIPSMWFHLYHECLNSDEAQYNKNYKHFQEKQAILNLN